MLLKIAAIYLFSVLLLAALLFIPAGRLNWPAGWIALALQVVGFSAVTLHVARRVPGLVQRRTRAGAGTPLWDRIIVTIFQLLYVAILVVAGLDARFHWSTLSVGTQVAGVILFLASVLLLGWAMGQNPHFEATVRIQTDQAHRVIDTGPYRIVRHPGYVAGIVLLIGLALVLDSAWALLPALLGTVAMVIRTALEDRFLLANLAGYREFARRTRYRLVPGVW